MSSWNKFYSTEQENISRRISINNKRLKDLRAMYLELDVKNNVLIAELRGSLSSEQIKLSNKSCRRFTFKNEL